MYLANIKIQNFRCINQLELHLHNGLNVLLGENDSGKTALVDAIRLVLGTRDFERINLSSDDFFVDENGRACNLKIELEFDDLSDEEARLFLEWIGIKEVRPDGTLKYFFKVILNANRKEINLLANKYDREISYTVLAGPDDVGTSLVPEVRDLLRATYLKPLRDAEQELAARKGSRLSQILIAHPEIRQQNNPHDVDSIPGIIHEANERVREHPTIRSQSENLNRNYLSNFTLGDESIAASINVSDPSLKGILERLELSLDGDISGVQTKHGLGINNLLFMATEMLLLGSPQSPELPLLLIEEPEAHLHPQLQTRLMEFLQQKSNNQGDFRPVQVILTSHSPNLAPKAGIENVILIRSGKASPLGPKYTRLVHGDYKFLQRFLDVTKANLFFARGVIIVEGDAEQIILPSIANLIGLSFEKYGVTIVNVGSVGLFRYARIFQRQDEGDLGIRVACLTDMDLPPDEARPYLDERETRGDFTDEQIAQSRVDKESRSSGGPVRTFVSPSWTLEFDICNHHPGIALLMHQAVQLAVASKNSPTGINPERTEQIMTRAKNEFRQWRLDHLPSIQIATNIYEPLFRKRASKPEAAQFLTNLLEDSFSHNSNERFGNLFPDYIVSAIRYVTLRHP